MLNKSQVGLILETVEKSSDLKRYTEIVKEVLRKPKDNAELVEKIYSYCLLHDKKSKTVLLKREKEEKAILKRDINDALRALNVSSDQKKLSKAIKPQKP